MQKRLTVSYLALPKRPGFAAFEAIAAVAILAVLLAIAGQMSGAMLHHRRSVERHRIAMDAKTNLMNIAMALPYDEITPDRLETIAAEFTPERASWEILVAANPREESQDEEPAERRQDTSFQPHTAKRIVIALHFTNSARRNAPNRPLVAWRYPSDPPVANCYKTKSAQETFSSAQASPVGNATPAVLETRRPPLAVPTSGVEG